MDVMITLFTLTHVAGEAQQVGSMVTTCISEVSVGLQVYFEDSAGVMIYIVLPMTSCSIH